MHAILMQYGARDGLPNLRSNDVNDSHALNLWINNKADQ